MMFIPNRRFITKTPFKIALDWNIREKIYVSIFELKYLFFDKIT